MASVNRVILIGNATRDAELRQTTTGKPVANVRLATHRGKRDNETTQFHTIVCWDKLAETVAQYVTKGRLVYVEGRLEYRTFADEEGKERGSVEIVANDVQFLDKPGASARTSSTGRDPNEESNEG